jgi:hypothetical protein
MADGVGTDDDSLLADFSTVVDAVLLLRRDYEAGGPV